MSGSVTAQRAALDYLRSRIADGSLPPDARLLQERLAEELGSSVIPVREALKTLEAEGQVVYVAHRGYQVRRLGITELVETYQLRELLEDEAVRLAVPTLDAAAFDALEELILAMDSASAAEDIATMTEANREFHFAIYSAAGLPRMTDFIRQLWQSTDAYRSRYYAELDHRTRVNQEHRQMVSALRDRETERAIEVFRTHRDAAVTALSSLL